MSPHRSLAASAALVLLGAIGAVGCSPDSKSGSQSEKEKAAEQSSSPAQDAESCTADATPLEPPYGAGFPEDWPFPPNTVVYGFEDRGDAGTIVSAISSAPFEDILDFMNNQVVDAGFEIESGETEDRDAEAEWRSSDLHGRWAIRESTTCQGETAIQVLAGEN